MNATPVPLMSAAHVRILGRRGGVESVLLPDWSLQIAPGEAVGLVGESGSGKSLAALALAGLLPAGTRLHEGSEIEFEGHPLVGATSKVLRGIRGSGIAYVFQDPKAALDPLTTVGAQLVGTLVERGGMKRAKARARALALLSEVELEASRVAASLPDELSGGMAQRATIALALALHPRLLVADEPTSALDGSVRGQILDLLTRLRETRRMAMLLISHDLGVVARTCDRIAVQYRGVIVEEGPTAQVLERPGHPYTRALLRALPSMRADGLPEGLSGAVPELGNPFSGCVFEDRCPLAEGRCSEQPPVRRTGARRFLCWLTHEPGAADA